MTKDDKAENITDQMKAETLSRQEPNINTQGAELKQNQAESLEDEIPADSGNLVEISQEEFSKLVESVTKVVNEKEEAEQKLVRMTADFDNFRRRTRLEKEETVKYANQQLMVSLLPVLDNFERAMLSADDSLFAEGINMIYRQMEMILTQEGLEKIATLEHEFDPQFHDAVMKEEVSEELKGRILEEIQTGYSYKGKLLRPARVKVGV